MTGNVRHSICSPLHRVAGELMGWIPWVVPGAIYVGIRRGDGVATSWTCIKWASGNKKSSDAGTEPAELMYNCGSAGLGNPSNGPRQRLGVRLASFRPYTAIANHCVDNSMLQVVQDA